MARNDQQGEGTSRIQDAGRRGHARQKTELIGREGLMAPFSTRRERKDDTIMKININFKPNRTRIFHTMQMENGLHLAYILLSRF